MANPESFRLTPHAIETACNGDRVARNGWNRMTRADTAVTATTATLHGHRKKFDLWASATWQDQTGTGHA